MLPSSVILYGVYKSPVMFKLLFNKLLPISKLPRFGFISIFVFVARDDMTLLLKSNLLVLTLSPKT